MTDTHEERFDELLVMWHQWQTERVTRGWHRRALVVGDYRVTRQYDDQNGKLDAEIEHGLMKCVDFQVSEIVEPYRSALYCLAKALTIGVTVFTSPRLPSDKVERELIVVSARRIGIDRFHKAGLL